MKRKELLDNIKLILPLLNQYNDGTIHVQISFLQGLECALENGDSLPTIREIKDILYPPRGGLSDFSVWKNDYLEKNKLIGNYMDAAGATEYVTAYEKDFMAANGIQ